MAKRRITLTSQEMNDIQTRVKTLESQLKRSNGRVDELEHGLGLLHKLVTKKSKPKSVEALCTSVEELTKITLNPPVKAKAPVDESLIEEKTD